MYLYLCIWMSDTWEQCFWGPRIITFSKIYHMLGLSSNLTQTVFVYLCICICVFGCQTLGNIVFEVLVPIFKKKLKNTDGNFSEKFLKNRWWQNDRIIKTFLCSKIMAEYCGTLQSVYFLEPICFGSWPCNDIYFLKGF